jgi:hypothetical protein
MDFKLERTDGTPADPPTYQTGVYSWRPGGTIPMSATRTLRVVEVRGDDSDEPPVLVVEDLPGSATSAAANGRLFSCE